MTPAWPRRLGIRTTASVCAVALAIAAITSIPSLALSAVVVATIAAGFFGASIAHPIGSARSPLRTAVVLGALAYLVALPVVWLTTRHVPAIAEASPEAWTDASLVALLATFVAAFWWASDHQRRSRQARRTAGRETRSAVTGAR